MENEREQAAIYELGAMDLLPIYINKTKVENSPFLQVVLDEPVEPERLRTAVKRAMQAFPLFGCRLRYKKTYYLEENEAEFPLFHTKTEDRPKEYGKTTNEYLWQICFFDCAFSLEWCHAVADGKAGFAFFKAILNEYFHISESEEIKEFPLEPGLEHFYDKNEKGIPQKKQPGGFQSKALPYIKRGYKTDCHIVKIPMSEVLSVAHKNDASPAAVIPPLFSKALRTHLKPEEKNRKVSCNVIIDCRTPMEFQTMHNCVIPKNITYLDEFDTMDFSKVSTIYRAILDLAVQKENVVHEATKLVDAMNAIKAIHPKGFQSAVGKLLGKYLKHSSGNFVFTYLGKADFHEQVMEHVVDFNFRSWTDYGECNVAATDFNGTLILNICENFQNKEIIPTFLSLCKEQGISGQEVENFIYEQANMRMS